MLQRPQSILLLVVIIALLLMTLLPIWTKQSICYNMLAWCFPTTSSGGNSIKNFYFHCTSIGCLSLTAAGIAAYALCRYDNRVVQLKLGILNALMMIVLLGYLLYLTIPQDNQWVTNVPLRQHSLGFLLLAVALFSNLLANRCIRKDEKLVRSAERMRWS